MATTKRVKFYSVGAENCHVYSEVAELIGNRQGYLSVVATSKREAAEIVDRASGVSGITAREFNEIDNRMVGELHDAGFLVEAGDLIVEDLRHEKAVKVDGDTAQLVAVRSYDRNTKIMTLLVEREIPEHDIRSLKRALELVDSFSLPCDEEFQRPLGVWLQVALDDLTATVMVPPGEELRPTTSSALEFAQRLVERQS